MTVATLLLLLYGAVGLLLAVPATVRALRDSPPPGHWSPAQLTVAALLLTLCVLALAAVVPLFLLWAAVLDLRDRAALWLLRRQVLRHLRRTGIEGPAARVLRATLWRPPPP